MFSNNVKKSSFYLLFFIFTMFSTRIAKASNENEYIQNHNGIDRHYSSYAYNLLLNDAQIITGLNQNFYKGIIINVIKNSLIGKKVDEARINKVITVPTDQKGLEFDMFLVERFIVPAMNSEENKNVLFHAQVLEEYFRNPRKLEEIYNIVDGNDGKEQGKFLILGEKDVRETFMMEHFLGDKYNQSITVIKIIKTGN